MAGIAHGRRPGALALLLAACAPEPDEAPPDPPSESPPAETCTGAEVCNGRDDDCDGLVDDADPDRDPAGGTPWYADPDGDGVGAGPPTSRCAGLPGEVEADGDCAPEDSDVRPGALEVCNGRDDDCDALVDDADPDVDLSGGIPSWADVDGDGFGDPGAPTMACSVPEGSVTDDSDCAPLDPAVHTEEPWWPDGDGDGDGDPTTEPVWACGAPLAHAATGTDCDDGDPGRTGSDRDADGLSSCAGDCDDADPTASSLVFGSGIPLSTDTLGSRDVEAGDLDGDGDLDLVQCSIRDDTVSWFENQGARVFAGERIVSTAVDGCRDVDPVDLDGDGDLDLATASSIDDTVGWFENLGGGVFGPRNVVADRADSARGVAAGDLDGDGDLDLVSASHEDWRVDWYENQGAGVFGRRQRLADGYQPFLVEPADLDQDGDLDLVFGQEWGDWGWIDGLGGGTFAAPRTTSLPFHDNCIDIAVADVEGDGGVDIVTANDAPSTLTVFWDRRRSGFVDVENQPYWNFWRIRVVDLDGDGDGDIVATVNDSVVWYENLEGDAFSPMNEVAVLDGVFALAVADLDGDGFLDIVATSVERDRVVWYPGGCG